MVCAPVRASLLALLLTSALAAAAEKQGSARVGLELGADTNPAREFGVATRPDVLATVRAGGEGLYRFDRFQLVGAYDLGARKFLQISTEDTLVQAASLDFAAALSDTFGAGLEGRIKDRRGGSRSYSDLVGGPFVEYVPDARLNLRLRLMGHRFHYPEALDYSFGAPELGLTARYRFDRRHSVLAFFDGGQRTYLGRARAHPLNVVDEVVAPPRRVDSAFFVGTSYSYRGPFAFTAAYSFADQTSNSFGEAQQRHRVGVTFGYRLPFRIIALAQASVQLARYPDGVFLSPEIILVEDDENLNSLTLKLSRALSSRFDVEVRYGLYAITLSRNDLNYLRQIGSVGVTARF